MTEQAIIAKSVRRSFDGRAVLDGVDLTLEPGEFVALLGKSGCGKSTLLRAFASLDDEVEGTIWVPERRAIVFQNPRLLPWKRVLDNVRLGLQATNARDVARAALGEVGLASHERAWPLTLSGGEAQRAALARALVRDPQLLLLDEPFGALDALTRIKMHELLRQLYLRHRPAIVMVTHDVDEALELADRVVVLRDGRVSLDFPVEVPRPRDHAGSAFNALRQQLLEELGVRRHDSLEAA